LNHLKLEKPMDLIPWAYNDPDQGWKRIADLAPLAFQCAQKGDEVSINILDHAATQLQAKHPNKYSYFSLDYNIEMHSFCSEKIAFGSRIRAISNSICRRKFDA
jgi:hypothetical protein